MTHLSIVVPVYNESKLISELVNRISTNAKGVTEDFEIILVDDGSVDGTWEIIRDQKKIEKKLKGLKFSRNFGQHHAISAGLDLAEGEWIIVMDGDLQDRPEVIKDLYQKAQEGFDIVFVSRKNRPESILYKIAQRIFYFLLRQLSGINFNFKQANFSIIHKRVAESYNQFSEVNRFYGSTILWLGYKRGTIFADHGTRFSGRPAYTIRKRFKLALEILISSSTRPMHGAIIFGLVFIFLSAIQVLWLIMQTSLYEINVDSWRYIFVTIIFVGGIILMNLGIFGLYLSQMHFQIKKRPMYIIDKFL
jgi:glycosyltransferase involved in cell wall biosynthesis